MRTTVTIDDALLRRSKREAKAADLTLGQFIEAALQDKLAARPSRPEGPPVPIFRRGTGPAPGVDLTSNRGLFEALGGE